MRGSAQPSHFGPRMPKPLFGGYRANTYYQGQFAPEPSLASPLGLGTATRVCPTRLRAATLLMNADGSPGICGGAQGYSPETRPDSTSGTSRENPCLTRSGRAASEVFRISPACP